MASTFEDEEPAVATQAGQPAAREGYDIGRLLAFTDGVFAIAVTLLVLSIPVPNLPAASDPGARSALLAAALAHLAPNLTGFVVSFILVGAQWIIHHRMLRQLDFCDGALLWLNLLILLGICLVPFGTGVLVHYGDTATGAIAYAGLQVGIGVSFLAMRLYLAARGALPRGSALQSAVALGAFVVSIPLALWKVNAAYGIWMAGFALARVIDSRVRGSRR